MKTHQKFKSVKPNTIFICYIILFFLGCTKAHYSVNRQIPIEILEDDKIAVLDDTVPYSRSSLTESKICNCISKAIKKLDKKIEIVPSESFRQAAFADIQKEPITKTSEAIKSMLSDSTMVKNIEGLGVRYVILYKLTTKKHYEKDSSGLWAAGGHSGVAFGYHASIGNVTNIYGEVYDFKRRCGSGRIDAIAEGQEGAGTVLIVPYYWPAFDESLACKEFGKGVAEFLIGQD